MLKPQALKAKPETLNQTESHDLSWEGSLKDTKNMVYALIVSAQAVPALGVDNPGSQIIFNIMALDSLYDSDISTSSMTSKGCRWSFLALHLVSVSYEGGLCGVGSKAGTRFKATPTDL